MGDLWYVHEAHSKIQFVALLLDMYYWIPNLDHFATKSHALSIATYASNFRTILDTLI